MSADCAVYERTISSTAISPGMASSKILRCTDLSDVKRDNVTHPNRAISSRRIPNPPTIFHLRPRRTRPVSSTRMKPTRPGLFALGVAGLGLYAFVEPYLVRLTRKKLPIRHGAPALSVLHLSDTHLAAGDRVLRRFLEDLPGRVGFVPDIVAATGDLIEEDGAIDEVVSLLAGIEARIGRFFVYGSHDYFESTGPSY